MGWERKRGRERKCIEGIERVLKVISSTAVHAYCEIGG